MKKLFTLFTFALFIAANAMAYDTWTVVGSKAILNGTTDWAQAETANDLTTTDGTNYTLTVTDKTLEAGTTYEYKFAKEHKWENGEFPSSNAQLSVSETAVYTIVYTVNVSTQEHSANTTKTGEAGAVTHEYSIAGSSTELFGASWSETNTATDMTKGDDGTYTWTKENVTLSAGEITYKVVVDHAWGTSYPSSNATLNIEGSGTYNVTITFNPTTKDVSSTAEAVSAVTTEYYVAHNAILNTNEWVKDGDKLTKTSEGIYSKTFENVVAGTIKFKVTNGTWNNAKNSECIDNDNSNITLSDDGTDSKNISFTLTVPSNVTITYTSSTNKISVNITELAAKVTVSDVLYATYYNSTKAYTMPDGLEGITVTSVSGSTLTLNHSYAANSVVPAGEPLILHATEAKDYVLTFTTTDEAKKTNILKGTSTADEETTGGTKYYRLSTNNDDVVGFYYGATDGGAFKPGANKAYLALPVSAPTHFSIEEEEEIATSIDAIESNTEIVKYFENGQLMIKKGDVIYNALGQIVK